MNNELSKEALAAIGSTKYFIDNVAKNMVPLRESLGDERHTVVGWFDSTTGVERFTRANMQVISAKVSADEMVNFFGIYFGEMFSFSPGHIIRKIVKAYYEHKGNDFVNFVIYLNEPDSKIIRVFIEEWWLKSRRMQPVPSHYELEEIIIMMVKKMIPKTM